MQETSGESLHLDDPHSETVTGKELENPRRGRVENLQVSRSSTLIPNKGQNERTSRTLR